MSKRDLKITVASQLLSGLCLEESHLSVQDRESELRHSLQLAEALIRLADDEAGPALEHTPPLYAPAEHVQERTIEREPVGPLIQARRAATATKPSRGPTLH